jgi:hypothetical protein
LKNDGDNNDEVLKRNRWKKQDAGQLKKEMHKRWVTAMLIVRVQCKSFMEHFFAKLKWQLKREKARGELEDGGERESVRRG